MGCKKLSRQPQAVGKTSGTSNVSQQQVFTDMTDNLWQDRMTARDAFGQSLEFKKGGVVFLPNHSNQTKEMAFIEGAFNYYFTPDEPDPSGAGRAFAPALCVRRSSGDLYNVLAESVEASSLQIEYHPERPKVELVAADGVRINMGVDNSITDSMGNWFAQFQKFIDAARQAGYHHEVTTDKVVQAEVNIERLEEISSALRTGKNIRLRGEDMLMLEKCLRLQKLMAVNFPRGYTMRETEMRLFNEYRYNQGTWKEGWKGVVYQKLFLDGYQPDH